ncbi:MmgE/PrpD family protein [Planococcus sp. 1R117A]|uniref:MmgE/PrpD family protein n=1 Tax=Planococcus sp. 1R117A TaxID=3447020 RepID=UPI003EDBFC5C
MLTLKLAKRINHPPVFSEKAYAEARRGLTDFFASAFAAKEEAAVKNILQLRDEPSSFGIPVIGQGKSANPAQAALFNGFIGHLLDYDDVHEDVRGHPSTVLVPALLSALSFGQVEGKRFLEAYIVGVETMAVIGKAIGRGHYEKGWHNTSTLGGIAAAAACSYLLRFSDQTTSIALGMAATQSSGLRVQFGTETKPLHAGLAAQAGYQAAAFAKAGVTGSTDALGGPSGFFSVYGNGVEEIEKELPSFGEEWKIVSPGMWFKQYPFCSAAHQGADAIKAILTENPFSLDEVEHITVTFPPGGDAALVHQQPATGEEGRFSIEYVIALAIDGQSLEPENFSFQPIDPKHLVFLERISRKNSAEFKASAQAVPKGRFTHLDCVLKSGEQLSKQVDSPKGAPNAPLSDDELAEKLKLSTPDGDGNLQAAIDELLAAETMEHLLGSLNTR